MREIKFRAWDKWGKCWFGSFYVDPNGEINYLSRDGMEQDEDRFILVQYTGLKDKNSKEIYEGDILRDEIGTLATVEWGELDTDRYWWWGIGFSIYFDSSERQVGEGIEIIGNIYESNIEELSVKNKG